jgi:hypothetical protein
MVGGVGAGNNFGACWRYKYNLRCVTLVKWDTFGFGILFPSAVSWPRTNPKPARIC